jgi:Protein of unknown function (DUF3754)
MAEYKDREHFLPIRKADLIDLLCRSKAVGSGKLLTATEQDEFRRFCTILAAYYHFEFLQRLDALKDSYAPFDPDRDTKVLVEPGADERAKRLDALMRDLDELLVRGNFRKLTHEQIEAATNEISPWGINLDVDFGAFDRLEIYVRGEIPGTRTLRKWYKPWVTEQVPVRVYQRLALVIKQRRHKRLSKYADTKNIMLKIFKDIPKVDLEMLIPGGRPKMPRFDRGKLGASFASAVGFIGWKIWNDFASIAESFMHRNPLALYGPVSLVLGYGYKQYAGYQWTKQQYSVRLTESLYYQNLDSNAGVLDRLLDEAEEQDCREAFLAYFHLWRDAPPEGWTPSQLDDYVEMELERIAQVKFDFEIDDALGKLERLQLVTKSGAAYRAVPIDEAMRRVDEIWDNIFPYNN